MYKRQNTILPGKPEETDNEISIELPAPEQQAVCLNESYTHRENPGKPLRPGEYPEFDELITTAGFPHIDRGDGMVDSGGWQETPLLQASQTPSYGAALMNSRDLEVNRTLEEERQYNNEFMIVLAGLDSERPRLGSHEVNAGEELIGNADPDALWDRRAPND